MPRDRTTTAIPGSHLRQDSSLSPHAAGDALSSSRRTPSSSARRYPRSGLSLPASELQSLLPSFEAASLLVDTYFDRAHWFMLIFQQDEFRQRWPKLYQRHTGRAPPLVSNTAFLSTFLVVIAIGLHYVGSYRQSLLAKHGIDPSLKDRILSCVRAKLLDVMSLGSLEAVQTCVLLGTYYLYHGSPRLAWPVCGCGLRIGQALHLHRRVSPSGCSGFRQQYETRKRCWWAIYEIETFSAVVYGYPHSIWDADCDVEPLDPSAKVQAAGSAGSSDEAAGRRTTLLSYKCLMSELSVLTKAALGELYRTSTSSTDDGRPYRSRADLQDTIQEVMRLSDRLRQWQARLPSELQWDRVCDRVNYSTPEEVDRDVGASGPRFENHIYQLQAMALMLAYEIAIILVHRPLLSYKLRKKNEPGVFPGDSGRADQSTSNPFTASLDACRAAALRMSSIQSSPILNLVAETYAATFVSIHTFTAGVTLGILCSMDPLNSESGVSKLALQKVMAIQEALKSRSVVAEQGLDILQRLTKLVMQKELDVLLGRSSYPASAQSDPTVGFSNHPLVGNPPEPSEADASHLDNSRETTGIDDSTDTISSWEDVLYMNDPALTEALHDFDQALLSYAPQSQAESEEPSGNPVLWPATLDGFPILQQTWLWDIDNDLAFGIDPTHSPPPSA
ncbi:transcription factor domain-containing protein [Aspergillus saccharolyticus JOP 1030-1]|uniref:Xylanolytic transcriptional activator regulatory domain-containing protein n=1 Tax=Aspergillus saccharolyticus JOP 1030-1 TaxID=1450539 RepID=A0A318Z377_9EURO|nr:hypothetical protein BP01DRAFT_307275 [Aspergillus saccharolyticus JOP 1030-1]PYH40844.1 hypothetical protein BP01DRAFT_307275 [Aspergillus saccharolyticus JOP 1030-1]